MIKYIALFLLAFTVVSCNFNRKKGIIPRDKFVSILTDIHMTEGYYATRVREIQNHNDSSYNFYNYILKNYGYNRADFDTTLKYYVVHTQEFDLLYEDVITELNKTEQENYQFRPLEQSSKNIWSGKNSWYLPKEGAFKKIPINMKLRGKGKYVISFTCKTFSDDKSTNPRLSLYFTYDKDKVDLTDSLNFTRKILDNDESTNPFLTPNISYIAKSEKTDTFCITCKPLKDRFKPALILDFSYDNTKTAVRDTFQTVFYVKDARTTLVTATKSLENKKYTHLRGFLLNSDDKPKNGPKHVIIEGFKIQFVSSTGL